MKVLKKLIPVYIIMVCCALMLSGCAGVTDYEGRELVERAKKLHTELEAAHITVTDSIGGTVVQEIDYRFAGDVMQYMYIGRDPETGEEYYEFNNGTELDTWHTGDEKWSFAAKGSEDFYNYSRANRHYFADGAWLLDEHISAISSSERGNFNGNEWVKLTYDDAKISAYETMTGVKGFEQAYTFEEGDTGYCCALTVKYNKDGREYAYATYIGYRDPGKPIERAEPPALSEKVSGEITEAAQ